MDSHVQSNRNEVWTEEKHVHFLNSMEAWFVRTMLENDDRFYHRLDRHLPDSSDSTVDCKRNIQKRKEPSTSGKSRSKIKKKRPDKRSFEPHNSSQDQVVPQIKN